MDDGWEMLEYIQEVLDIWKDDIKNVSENNGLYELMIKSGLDRSCAIHIELSMTSSRLGDWPEDEPTEIEDLFPSSSPEENERLLKDFIKDKYKGGGVMPIHYIYIIMAAKHLEVPLERIKDLEYEVTKDMI